ncbi:MAG TPA: hypothetical protein VKZ59_15665, partial [Acidobacteriota bacterium]|nr:hypothetical protein [Acidobacteriota bacterium]
MMTLCVRLFLALLFLLAGWGVYNRWSALGVFAQNPSLEGVLESIKRDPTGPEYHFLAGLLYRDQIDYLDTAKGRQHLERALELNPYSWRYWLEMGRTIELEEPSEAEAAYRQALELNPNAASYHWRVANFYIRREEFRESIPHLVNAATL